MADIATFTFKGTLAQMDKLPGLTFAQSQAAIYEAMEKDYPDLFQRIARKIKEGTWVPVGGMWVEPDLNMPDGESLARQLLYGKRYFLDKFGIDVKVGWNPDSFGHNWQLPQILRKAGIDSYVFGRCAPGPDPTHFFWWEGMDGSRVLGYVPPGWYNVDLGGRDPQDPGRRPQEHRHQGLHAALRRRRPRRRAARRGHRRHQEIPERPERAAARVRPPRSLFQEDHREGERTSPSSSASSTSPSRPATRPRRRRRRTTVSSKASFSPPRISRPWP